MEKHAIPPSIDTKQFLDCEGNKVNYDACHPDSLEVALGMFNASTWRYLGASKIKIINGVETISTNSIYFFKRKK